MGRIWMPGGGGGVDLDAITATFEDVLKGKVIVGPDGEPLTGVLELTGNAADSQVLLGKTYYNTDAKTKRTGTMLNRGAVSPGGLNAGESYTIPEGYHNGAGKVTTNSLVSQTDANAAAGDILKGKTGWVKGSKVTGTMANHAGTPQHIDARRIQNNRFEVAVAAGYHGYSWAGNSYEYMELSEVAGTLGLTAAKLAKGQTVCGVAGTYTSDADAAAGNILSGKIAYVKGSKVTGNMTNQGAKTASLNCGGSYTIPAGYHNGSGKVTANSLSSQTDATAAAGNILSGKTAWVKGSKITGTMAVQSILSFSAAPYGAKQVTFTWKNPAKGPFSGVIIVYKTGSYPTSITDGTRIYKGSGNNTSASGSSSATCTMPAENTTYYFRAFSYAVKDNAEWVHATTYTATAKTSKSLHTFTSSGTFTVPPGVSKIDIFCVGGGGGGAGGYASLYGNWRGGGGGGGGYTATVLNKAVTPGSSLTVTVGAGGSAAAANSMATGGTGGTSSVGSLVSAKGGTGGRTVSNGGETVKGGGSGGSGGGAGPDFKKWVEAEIRWMKGTTGGSNGSDGGESDSQYSYSINGGTGQGTTTRSFGESSGTLYAGGGGSGPVFGNTRGAGGSGGGGSGGWDSNGAAGTANTGGGGGGGCGGYSGGGNTNNAKSSGGGAGGSGIVIIRIK